MKRIGQGSGSMGERRTHVILLLLILCVLAGMNFGCGRATKTEKEENSGRKILTDKEAAVPETNAASVAEETVEEEMSGNKLPETTEKEDLTLQEELRPSILQIFCGDYRGSGVVWEITEEEVTVVSSGHLLKNGETCEVLCYAGIYYEAKVDRILEDCDIGFAVFPVKALKEDGIELIEAVPCERSKEELVQGEELVVYGSMYNVAGDFVNGYLIEAESKIQFEGYDSAQFLMLGGIVRDKGEESGNVPEGGEADVRETGDDGNTVMPEPETGLVDAGMSGCGVFDRQGKLLGILAGGDGVSSFAAVPVWVIVRS